MDLNMMMREQARNGLQLQLDAAVTNGDAEAARKISDQIAELAVSTAPKPAAFGQAEIRAELDKQDWFGIDPKKSARAMELGKSMDPKKFSTAAAFAEALVKAVNEEFKPANATSAGSEGTEDDEDTDGDDTEDEPKPKPKPKRSDAPGEGDALQGRAARRSGPWTKLSDAPADVQKEVERAADKFVPARAPKETREKFIANALASHYNAAQRAKGRK